MPRYIVHSEGPISVREVHRPDLPGWTPETGLPGTPEHPWVPGPGFPRPPEGWERPELPPLPPRDDLIDMLPPGLKPGPGHPIPPMPDHPWIPVDPAPEEPEIWPPPGVVWPPLRPEFPGLPDMTGKTLVLALLYVSRTAPRWGWVVIDHDAAKGFVQRVKEWLKARLPAGGVAGRPPQRPGPAE